MPKKPRKPVLLVKRDKLGRLIKASRKVSRPPFPRRPALNKSPVKASLPLRKKKQLKQPTFKKPTPTKRLPVKIVVSSRKKKQKAKPRVSLPKKRRPLKVSPPPRKKKRPSKVSPQPSKKRKSAKSLPSEKRKPAKPAKPLPSKKRKPAKPAKPLPPKKPIRKKPKKKGPKAKRRYPSFMANSAMAESMIVDKLTTLGALLHNLEPGLVVSVKSFINADSTVDGELRVSNLPEEWRRIEGLPGIISAVFEAVRGVGAFSKDPSVGGAFWISFSLRFGPKDMDDMMELARAYKRFKGLLQVGAHHTNAQSLPSMLNNVLALRMFIDRVWAKHSLPPVQILIRFVWTPKKANPGRFSGEEGSTK